MSAKPDFNELWRKLAPHVHAAVLRHRSRDLALAAEDIVQEVRIRVWNVYAGDTKSHLRTSYYYSVVNSAIIDCLRRHRGTLAHSVRAENAPGEDGRDEAALVEQIGHDDPGPDAYFAAQEQRRRLLAAIERLPADRRRAVTLFLQGFTVPEIAELFGCDRTRAHNLTYRGVRALKALMSEDE